MGKVKVSELKCFGEISSVIGKAQAEIELFKVVSAVHECQFEDHPDLDGAFVFDDTPQGLDFWFDIMVGINPYDN